MRRHATVVVVLCLSTISAFAQKPYDPLAIREPAQIQSNSELLPQRQSGSKRSPLSLQPKDDTVYPIDGSHRYVVGSTTSAEVGAIFGANAGGATFYEGGSAKIVIAADRDSYFNGNHFLGIQTATPVAPLSVATSSPTSGIAIGQVSGAANEKHMLLGYDTVNNYSSIQSTHEGTAPTPLILQGFGGSVNIGTFSPELWALQVRGVTFATGPTAAVAIRDRGEGLGDNWIWYSAGNVFRLHRSGTGDILSTTASGNVGIGLNFTANPAYRLHVDGAARFDGVVTGTVIRAHYQDVAEWVPAAADLDPGTVVILDTTASNQVMASTRAYDTSVAGVVSAQPGLLLGEGGAEKEQIATTGRVKVKVDASKHPIRIGDLLVTSDRSGYAMRSEPMAVGDRRLHQPGTIIGKALETLDRGVGEILVLLSLQ